MVDTLTITRFLLLLAMPLCLIVVLMVFAARAWGHEHPDTMMAYVWSNGPDNILRVIDMSHATEIELGNISTNFYSSPTWSIDGQLDFVLDLEGNLEVYVWDGDSLTNISSDTALDYAPVWSPDGRRLAFISRRTDNDQVYIWDGESLTNISRNLEENRRAAWSYDGRLALMSYHDGTHIVRVWDGTTFVDV